MEQPCSPGFSPICDPESISATKAKCWLTRELLVLLSRAVGIEASSGASRFHDINGLRELVAVNCAVTQVFATEQTEDREEFPKGLWEPHAFLLRPLLSHFHVVPHVGDDRIWTWNWGEVLWRRPHQHPPTTLITTAAHRVTGGMGWGFGRKEQNWLLPSLLAFAFPVNYWNYSPPHSYKRVSPFGG